MSKSREHGLRPCECSLLKVTLITESICIIMLGFICGSIGVLYGHLIDEDREYYMNFGILLSVILDVLVPVLILILHYQKNNIEWLCGRVCCCIIFNVCKLRGEETDYD